MLEFLRRLVERFTSPPIEPVPKALPKPAIRECCQNPDNLVRSHYGPDKTMDMCKVCGARHYILRAEPGKIAGKGMPVGKK